MPHRIVNGLRHYSRKPIASLALVALYAGMMVSLLVYLREPTELQITASRVMLAAAAAGIGVSLLRVAVLNISPSVQAGGAVALFAVFYWMNPVARGTSFISYSEAIRRADEAHQYTVALSLYQKAHQARPKSWEPVYNMGLIEYKRRNFTAAISHMEKAFELGGEKNGIIAYGLAMAQEGSGQYEEAIRTLRRAIDLLPSDTEIVRDVVYDRGLNAMLLWLKRDAPTETEPFRDAELAFRDFINRGGFPPHWALYHLACLKATRAEDTNLALGEVSILQAEARQTLLHAIQALTSYNSPQRGPLHRETARRLLLAPKAWSRRPGDPVDCPALIRAWMVQYGSVSDLIARLDE